MLLDIATFADLQFILRNSFTKRRGPDYTMEHPARHNQEAYQTVGNEKLQGSQEPSITPSLAILEPSLNQTGATDLDLVGRTDSQKTRSEALSWPIWTIVASSVSLFALDNTIVADFHVCGFRFGRNQRESCLVSS